MTVIIQVSLARYPEATAHAKDATSARVASGLSVTYTLYRAGAKKNRALSLKGIPSQKGLDRDEWPMALFKEGGLGASVKLISPSDNRGLGSFIASKLKRFPDGTRVLFWFIT